MFATPGQYEKILNLNGKKASKPAAGKKKPAGKKKKK